MNLLNKNIRLCVICLFFVISTSHVMVTPLLAQTERIEVAPPEGIPQPVIEDRYNVPLPGVDGESIEVFGAAQNARNPDASDDIYLYSPPLQPIGDGTGGIRFDIDEDTQTGITSVTFYLRVLADDLRGHAANYMQRVYSVDVSPQQIRPLQFSFMEVSRPGATWAVRIPERVDDTPVLSEQQPVTRIFGSRTDAEEFIADLEDGARLTVRIGYGGYTLTRNERTLSTSSLRRSNFVGTLQGPAGAEFVTRDQIRDALAFTAQRFDDTWYLEDPNLGIRGVSWFETFWASREVAWDEFLSNHAARVSRFTYSSDDLTPDKFTAFSEHLRTEMQDESKNTIDIDASFAAEAKFLDILGGKTSGSTSILKEDFLKRIRIRDGTVSWEGETFVPRTIELFTIDEEAINQESVIVSKTVATTSSRAVLERSIDMEASFTPVSAIPLECGTDVEVRVDTPVNVSAFLNQEAWLRRDQLDFETNEEFFGWLSRKPRLVVGSGGSLNFDTNVDFISACEIVLEDGGQITGATGSGIKLLTLEMVNLGGRIVAQPGGREARTEVPGEAGRGTNHSRQGRDGCFTTNAGGPGQPGQTGVTGLEGFAAPSLTLASLFVTGPLDVSLTGGQGGKGGKGGRGGDGQGAAGGSSGAFDCRCGGAPGRAGGPGGPGGPGGVGGTGGKGGDIHLVVANDLGPATSLTAQGGPGGARGPGGPGGEPGQGGNGHGGDGNCSRQRAGGTGARGADDTQSRPPGPSGQAGNIDIDVLRDRDGGPNYAGFASWVTSQR